MKLLIGGADVAFVVYSASAPVVLPGSLIMRGALRPPSYGLALKPASGAIEPDFTPNPLFEINK